MRGFLCGFALTLSIITGLLVVFPWAVAAMLAFRGYYRGYFDHVLSALGVAP